MDAISEALKVVRVTGAAFFNAEFTAPWGFASPPTETIASALSATGTERLAIYHLVLEGIAQIRIDGELEPPLAAGDLVILPHGHRHAMSNGRPRTLHDMARSLPQLLSQGPEVMRLGGDGPPTRFVCGYFGCDRHASRLFLSGLPAAIKVSMRDGARVSWLENSIRYAMAEAAHRKPGSGALLSKLSEALFVEALSRYMEQMPSRHGLACRRARSGRGRSAGRASRRAVAVMDGCGLGAARRRLAFGPGGTLRPSTRRAADELSRQLAAAAWGAAAGDDAQHGHPGCRRCRL